MESRKNEAYAQGILGYEQSFFFDYRDGYVGQDMRALTSRIDALVSDIQPEELYLPYPSMHQDHIATYEAGVRSARLSMSANHWYTPNLYVYEVSVYSVNLYTSNLKWDTVLSLSAEQVDKKRRATHAYGSQMVVGPHPVNGIKEMAHALGAAHGLAYAEQYAMLRRVVA